MTTLFKASPADTAGTGFFWYRAAAGLGLIWNLYGIYQFAGSFTQNRDSLTALGMTDAQAALYLGLPAWLSVAFALGVFGGTAGSALLGLRNRLAVPVFGLSLAGYAALTAGDIGYGVFAALPGQLAIIAVVDLVAIALLAIAMIAARRNLIN